MSVIIVSPYGLAECLDGGMKKVFGASGIIVHLFQNNMVPSANSVVTDFTEADFDGYNAQTVLNYIGPVRDVSGGFRIYNNCGWKQAGGTTQNTVYGWYALDAAGNLVASNRFQNPAQMVDQYSSLTFVIEFLLSPNGISGVSEPG